MDPRASHTAPPRFIPAPSEGQELAAFAHDLNNLLGIVIGNAELLLDEEEHVPKRRRRTKAIHTAATQAAELVRRIQDRGR